MQDPRAEAGAGNTDGRKMMGDLKERLRANGLDECDEAIAYIEALEARIAKADALVEVAERAIRLSQEYDSFKLYAMEPIWQALAAYREGSGK